MRFFWISVALAFGPSLHAMTCAELFRQTLTFARESDQFESTRAAPLVEQYARRGFKRGFAARQLAALVNLRGPMNLRLFDLTSEEFRRFARADPEPALRYLGQHDEGLGGVSYVTRRDNAAFAVIAVNPRSKVHAFADTMMEETVHLRLHHQWAVLDFGEFTPFIFTEAGLGMRRLLDEMVAKEILAVYGRGEPRDRETLLAELLNDVDRNPELGARGFPELIMTLIWCAEGHGTTWRDLPLSRMLRCAYGVGPEGPTGLRPLPAEKDVETVIRIAYAVNQRFGTRVKKRPDGSGH